MKREMLLSNDTDLVINSLKNKMEADCGEKKWITEIDRGIAQSYQISRILDEQKSDFQKIKVFKTTNHGKLLTLDDSIMLNEKHEFIYHEMLTHVAMFSHPNPEHVLIIGGGDGGAAREVLKHKSVKSLELVEIDKQVIEISKKHFSCFKAAFKDPRLKIINNDGANFVKKIKNKYDVVLVDSTDPSKISMPLFSRGFYANVRKAMKQYGVFISQSHSPLYDSKFIRIMHQRMKCSFYFVFPYLAFVPYYLGGCWSFTFASNMLYPTYIKSNPPRTIKTKYYSEKIHESAFVIPDFIKQSIGCKTL
ncbi:MAG: polyamine aminopropyltransferase [Candidatus Goldbacteria bacterium]|nr:polyamine aminopropyltransferase [Candidatus Goldiibacteriota bacterium]